MLKKVHFILRGKSFFINAEKTNFLSKIWGLMFSKRNNSGPLLFEFSKPTQLAIHSFFVFYPFLAIWIDDKDKVIKFKIIKPFSISEKPAKKYSKLLEIPINRKNSKFLHFSSVTRNIYKD